MRVLGEKFADTLISSRIIYLQHWIIMLVILQSSFSGLMSISGNWESTTRV